MIICSPVVTGLVGALAGGSLGSGIGRQELGEG
jgi:hypothetical protein